jgi:hypothetical protein
MSELHHNKTRNWPRAYFQRLYYSNKRNMSTSYKKEKRETSQE